MRRISIHLSEASISHSLAFVAPTHALRQIRRGGWDVEHLAGWLRPVVVETNDGLGLVAGHLGLLVILDRRDEDVEVLALERSECSEPTLAMFRAVDEAVCGALCRSQPDSINKEAKRSRPVRAKREARRANQVCPVCISAEGKLLFPLSRPRDWKRRLKAGDGGIVRCKRCGLAAQLSAAEFREFCARGLTTPQFLRAKLDQDGKLTPCPRCGAGKILVRLAHGHEYGETCSNRLREPRTCEYRILLPRGDA